MTLIQVSQMVIDLPEMIELDINPLRCDSSGVLALDAAIKVAPALRNGADRLAIRPYPAELEEWFTMTDGRQVLLRPIRPEDEPNHHVLVSKLTPEDIRFRFFGLVHELPHSEMARLTQIDYDREMAFIGELSLPDGGKETLGVVRTVTDPDNEAAEFAVVVRSDLKGSGLGKRLLVKMIEYCRSRGTNVIVGQVLKDNRRMLKFVEHLGFVQTKTIDGDIVEVEYDLKKPAVTGPEPLIRSPDQKPPRRSNWPPGPPGPAAEQSPGWRRGRPRQDGQLLGGFTLPPPSDPWRGPWNDRPGDKRRFRPRPDRRRTSGRSSACPPGTASAGTATNSRCRNVHRP